MIYCLLSSTETLCTPLVAGHVRLLDYTCNLSIVQLFQLNEQPG